MIKKFFSLFAAILFAGSMMAGKVTITPSQALNEGGVDPITVVCAKGDGTSNPAISGGQLRLYQAASGKTTGNTITFSSSKSITSIVFTFANNMTASNGSFSEGSYDSESSTWTGSTTSLTLTVTGTSSSTRIYITNMVVTYDDGGTPVCETPTFDPEDGETFTDNIDVEIACATDGATIYYTTDGNDPTTSSNVYSTALNFTETTTLKAMAVKAGYDNSTVATAIYTKVVPFDGEILEITKDDFVGSYAPNNGEHTKDGITYTTNQVCLSSSSIQFQKTNGYLYNNTDLGEIAKIEITTVSGKSNNLVVYSGTTENPTSGTVTGSASGSVTTYTFASGKGFFAINCNSTGASNVDPIKIYYTPATPAAVAKPTISGETPFLHTTTVTLACTTEGATIRYTTDGTTPTASSTLYENPFELSATTTVKAISVKDANTSDVVEKTFDKIEILTVAEANAALAVSSSLEDKYVHGIISQIDGYNSTYKSITYWISDDGTTSGQLEVYSGKGLDGADFSSIDDLKLGDIVTVRGDLKVYNEINEFDKSSKIVEFERPVPTTPTISATPSTLDLGTVYKSSDREEALKTFTLTGVNLTNQVKLLSSGAVIAFDRSEYIDPTDGAINVEVGVYPYSTDAIGEFEATISVKGTGENPDGIDEDIVTVTWKVVAAPEPTGVFELYTGAIAAGKYLITYDNGAMNTTVTSNRIQFAEILPINNCVKDPDPSIVWTVAQSGDYWTLYNEEAKAYAAATGSKNQAQMLNNGTDDKAKWTVTVEDGKFEFENKARAAASSDSGNKWLRRNGNNGFATYASGTGGALTLFKYRPGWATSVDNTVDGKKAVKFIQNGQLFIELNGHVYNVQGQTVK